MCPKAYLPFQTISVGLIKDIAFPNRAYHTHTRPGRSRSTILLAVGAEQTGIAEPCLWGQRGQAGIRDDAQAGWGAAFSHPAPHTRCRSILEGNMSK